MKGAKCLLQGASPETSMLDYFVAWLSRFWHIQQEHVDILLHNSEHDFRYVCMLDALLAFTMLDILLSGKSHSRWWSLILHICKTLLERMIFKHKSFKEMLLNRWYKELMRTFKKQGMKQNYKTHSNEFPHF